MNKQGRKVTVEPTESLPSFLHDPPPWRPPTAGPTPPAAPRPVAILVCHGMGQQVPFETLSAVAAKLGSPGATPVVRHVRCTDPADPKRETRLPRAEILVARPGLPPQPVHVYEAYWAPLTEGRISLLEVVYFLLMAGARGLWQCRRPFQRWVFGAEQTYDRPLRTPLSLLGALLVIGSLVVINTILTLVGGVNVFGLLGTPAVSSPLISQLTLDLSPLLAAAALAFITLNISAKSSKWYAIPKQLATVLAWVGLLALLLATVYTAICLELDYFRLHNASAKPPPPLPDHLFDHLLRGWRARWLPGLPRPVLVGLVWGAMLVISLYARSFFIQFLGDVAIYLDSYKVDKFHKIRASIKQTALRTAALVYGAREAVPGPVASFLYDRVLLVGHSLGSVVSYDTLNALLNTDEGLAGQLHIAARTPLLLTYGSPLDKTAFLFNSQHPEAPLRDGLAASVQPLIRALASRRLIEWVNIYSNADIISGRLEFYELPPDKLPFTWPRVQNIEDEAASTPVLAHTQYGDNPLLTSILKQHVSASPY